MTVDSDFTCADGEFSQVAVLSDQPVRTDIWERNKIARLTPYLISFMPTTTLIRIIKQNCDFLPQPEVRCRLQMLDRPTLERLVYLVRHACRRRGY